MNKILPFGGILLAIGITTTMDATGLTLFSALPLLALTGLGWSLQRFSRREFGLTWGKPAHHGLAVLYPFAVLGVIALIGLLFGAVNTAEAEWIKTGMNILMGSTVGILGVLLTEEGFFRGWLWASLRRAGFSSNRTLLLTTIAFTLWHVSAITLDTGFDVPPRQVPLFLVNATLLGLVWGMLRQLSGSALVPAVSHAVWNGLDYPLFGFGESSGALGLTNVTLYGPEVGVLGFGCSAMFAIWLWRRVGVSAMSGNN